MRFYPRPLTREDADIISGWQYAAPYDVYGGEAPRTDVAQALCDAQGSLCGFFSWGHDAQVPAARDLYTRESALDIGIGLRPSLAGRGAGLFACEAALAWLRNAFAPACFRLAVYGWNTRAQKVYRRAGFGPQTVRGDFLIMTRDERPWRDATRPLHNGMPVYPADPGFDRHLLYRREDSGYDMSVFAMSAHSGTHLDAPAHLGLPGAVETIPLERLEGTVQLLEWPGDGVSAVRAPGVLLKTGGRGLWLREAQALLDAGVTLIGLDGMSVGEGDDEYAVHHLLLSAGVTVLENAAIEAFAPGWYAMRCLPLSMPGSDGVPARLLLREEGL